MGNDIVRFFFFANYFVGVLSVALSVETACQLGLPFNTPVYYLVLSLATVVYYTRAYTGVLNTGVSGNPRTEWYQRHSTFIRVSQLFFSAVVVLAGLWLVYRYWPGILALPLYYWLVLLSIPLAALLYYGLLPRSLFRINLRNTGWLKAFVIGFVWAGCVGILPVVAVRVQYGIPATHLGLILWLFVKNWMFCTVNAIMFDMKDYADDANHQLKTFVVTIGLRKTIYFVLTPILLVGLIAFFIFVSYRHFGVIPVLFNLIPYLCLLLVAYSMHRRKKILYYLIVIDGLILLKALCGIAGMFFVQR